MNDPSHQEELASLRRELQVLQLKAAQLSERMNSLERRVQSTKQTESTESFKKAVQKPPEIHAAPKPQRLASVETWETPAVPVAPTPSVDAASHTSSPSNRAAPSQAEAEAEMRNQAPTAAGAGEGDSFELKLGTYWLVRIGVLLLLTGLVFLGNYTYQNLIVNLGAGGKLSLMYAGSLALVGAGWGILRKERSAQLRNYGRVLLAGGMAAVYFTTYAAYYLPNLRVFPGPVSAGAVLLAWTCAMVLISVRSRSEMMGLFAIGLGYYTAAINSLTAFTLFSNFLLSLAGVCLLLLQRWVRLTTFALVATYLAYAFWRIYRVGLPWFGSMPVESVWYAHWFLSAYWVLFTVGGMLTRANFWSENRRAIFLSANNGLYFGLAALGFAAESPGAFWKLAFCAGTVWIGMAGLSHRVQLGRTVENAYLVQGVALVTLGCMTYFTGMQLPVVLSVQAGVLLVLSDVLRREVMRATALVVGMISFVSWILASLQDPEQVALWAGLATAIAYFFTASWWEKRTKGNLTNATSGEQGAWVLGIMAWLTGWVTLAVRLSAEQLPWVMGAVAVGGVAWFHRLGLGKIVLLLVFYLPIAHFHWWLEGLKGTDLAWWSPFLLFAATCALAMTRERWVPLEEVRQLHYVGIGFAAMVLISLLSWVAHYISASYQYFLLSGIALLVMAASLYHRRSGGIDFGICVAAGGFYFFVAWVLNLERVHWAPLAGSIFLLASQRAARRWGDALVMESRHTWMTALFAVPIWLWLTHLLKLQGSTSYWTPAWALLAFGLFGFGWYLRERTYRWLGLGLLGIALLRVVFFDVWQLELPVRILSFIALGLVLVVLGFLYNRYSEHWRKWL